MELGSIRLFEGTTFMQKLRFEVLQHMIPREDLVLVRIL